MVMQWEATHPTVSLRHIRMRMELYGIARTVHIRSIYYSDCDM